MNCWLLNTSEYPVGPGGENKAGFEGEGQYKWKLDLRCFVNTSKA